MINCVSGHSNSPAFSGVFLINDRRLSCPLENEENKKLYYEIHDLATQTNAVKWFGRKFILIAKKVHDGTILKKLQDLGLDFLYRNKQLEAHERLSDAKVNEFFIA